MNFIKRLNGKWAGQSLNRKWALTSAFVIFISFFLMSIVMYMAIYSWLLSDEKKAMVRSMQEVSELFLRNDMFATLQDLKKNQTLVNSIIDKNETIYILNNDGVELIRINDSVGKVADFNKNEITSAYSIEHTHVDTIPAYVATKKIEMNNTVFYMQLIHPLTDFNALMRYILTAMIFMGIIAIIFSSIIGSILASRLIKPLNNLRDDMTRVAANGFEADLKIEAKENDEIGDLVRVYQQMMIELEQSFLQQQQFISDASHELRTPIQVIEGHLSMIQRWGKDDQEVLEEALQTSLDEVKRMRSLIEELLALAKRQPKDETKVTDALIVTQEIVKETEQLYPSAKIQITCNAHRKNVMISQDAFSQIVRNLLQNAIRYNENIPTVNIHLTNNVNDCKVVVVDNGIGIAQNTLPLIFNRFYRVDQARSRESGGTGLGLTIVKMLVEKYDGSIEVASELGVGSTFIVTFQLEKS